MSGIALRRCSSPLLRRRSQRGPRDFCHGLLILLGHKSSGALPIQSQAYPEGYMTPKPDDASALSEIYELLRDAATRKQPIAAIYDGHPRLLCPHIGGRKSGRLHVLCYQFGGSSNSAESLAPEGEGVWRCLAVEKLSQVELRTEAWHTAPRFKRQTCIDEVDFDADVQPGDNPQKGQ